MNTYYRYCIVQGHQKHQTYHICTLMDCNLTSRWCCPTCIQKEIHKHNQANQSHVLSQDELQDKLKQDLINLQNYNENCIINKKETFKQIQSIIDEVLQYFNKYLLFIDQQLGNIEQKNQLLLIKEFIKSLNGDQYALLDNEKINKILKISQECNDKCYSYQQIPQPIEFVKEKINLLEVLLDENKNQKFMKHQYTLCQIDQTDKCYFASQISKNEKYLVYGGYNQDLNICELQNQNKITKKQLEAFMQVCQFSDDSTKLYVGSYQYVYGFDTQNNFIQFYRQFIHEDWINNIISVDDCIITCSDDKTIIKTNTKSNEQIFRLVGHTNDIIGLDYYDQKELLISASKDLSIKVWNCQKKSIMINKENAHKKEIRQIQLINQTQNILSLDQEGNLFLWKIDLDAKDLKFIQKINKEKIYNFYFTLQNQHYILICQNQLKILDYDLNTVNVIDHNCNEFNDYVYECKQLHNGNYIQIRTKKKMILASSKNYKLQI